MSVAATENGELRDRVRKAAHDSRTPPTSIAGFAQLPIEGRSLPADVRENAGIILAEAQRLSGMLNSFFDGLTATLDITNAE